MLKELTSDGKKVAISPSFASPSAKASKNASANGGSPSLLLICVCVCVLLKTTTCFGVKFFSPFSSLSRVLEQKEALPPPPPPPFVRPHREEGEEAASTPLTTPYNLGRDEHQKTKSTFSQLITTFFQGFSSSTWSNGCPWPPSGR